MPQTADGRSKHSWILAALALPGLAGWLSSR